ncbi:MAG: CoA-binding protein [Capsulimonadaceae bacterium]
MESQQVIPKMLNARSYCVIGASRDHSKYGYRVFRFLKSEGRVTYPVNPNSASIGQATCYPSVADLPEPVEVAVFVVPPAVTEKMLPQCLAAGIRNIWLQEGSESESAVAFCRENGMDVVAGGPCIMVEMMDGDEDLRELQ